MFRFPCQHSKNLSKSLPRSVVGAWNVSTVGAVQNSTFIAAQQRFVATSSSKVEINKRAEAVKQELAILAAAFERYDGAGKGALNPAELEEALKDLDLPAGDIDVKALFEELDINKDGTIELNEWLEALPRGTKLRILDKEKTGGFVQIKIPDVKIQYTYTDEAPMLATFSLLPVLRAFCRNGGVKIMKKDISVAARVRSTFPDYLTEDQRIDDDLQGLGDLAKTPSANIIKLPNVSASVPQLTSCIAELREKGYMVPEYPMNPSNEKEQEIADRYAKVLGSAVNPVLREGNSDRRVAAPVKAYALSNPPKNANWLPESKSHVSHMSDGDFFSSEQSWTNGDDIDSVRIEIESGGETTILKPVVNLLPKEVIDASCMSIDKLGDFFEETLQNCEKDVLWSLHLKATMMKISDPIMFGKAVTVYYKDVFAKHKDLFKELGVNPKNGLGDVYACIAGHAKEEEVKKDIMEVYKSRPAIAMVNSRKGITNLHVPSDVIVDASMAAAVRDAGRMWNLDDKLQDSKFVVPDRCYAGIYDAVFKDCIKNGKLDAGVIGHTPNVGLMAAKAEEYGSHDKTFEIPSDGKVRVVLKSSGEKIFEHDVKKGDIWRMCQTKDDPIQDWVKLAVNRARATKVPAVFWLTEERAHDRSIIAKVKEYLKLHDTNGLDISIKTPVDAMNFTLERARAGKDTITVTGNVLRDYLTDLFPILELGTSAKMLSVVPLMAGGGMFETGAGGSAPKHVQQFLEEGHLRWDSLGEFLAMAVAMEDLASKTDNTDAVVLSNTLNEAVGNVMNKNKSPRRTVMELDNRGSHFYLALFWAEALSKQDDSAQLKARFASVYKQLKENEARILGELLAAEGKTTDVGGYWMPDPFLASQAMRPSATFNSIIEGTMAASGF